MKMLYLALNLITLFFPLVLSFNRLGHFYKRFKSAFIAIGISGIIFIVWDIIFTVNGIWGFNDTYLIGVNIFHLPIEEWLFFLCIPYACLFLYDQLVILKIKNVLKPIERYLNLFMVVIALAYLFLGFGAVYTTTISILVLGLLYFLYTVKPANIGIFYLTYFIILIPFALINGILTGAKTEEPVVWYNNAENLGIRVGTIPIEDFLYYFLLFGMCYLIFEQTKKATKKVAH